MEVEGEFPVANQISADAQRFAQRKRARGRAAGEFAAAAARNADIFRAELEELDREIKTLQESKAKLMENVGQMERESQDIANELQESRTTLDRTLANLKEATSKQADAERRAIEAQRAAQVALNAQREAESRAEAAVAAQAQAEARTRSATSAQAEAESRAQAAVAAQAQAEARTQSAASAQAEAESRAQAAAAAKDRAETELDRTTRELEKVRRDLSESKEEESSVAANVERLKGILEDTAEGLAQAALAQEGAVTDDYLRNTWRVVSEAMMRSPTFWRGFIGNLGDVMDPNLIASRMTDYVRSREIVHSLTRSIFTTTMNALRAAKDFATNETTSSSIDRALTSLQEKNDKWKTLPKSFVSDVNRMYENLTRDLGDINLSDYKSLKDLRQLTKDRGLYQGNVFTGAMMALAVPRLRGTFETYLYPGQSTGSIQVSPEMELHVQSASGAAARKQEFKRRRRGQT